MFFIFLTHLLYLQIVTSDTIQINVKPTDQACSIGILCLDADGLEMVLISWAMKDPGEEGISLRPNLAKCIAGTTPTVMIHVQSQQNPSFMQQFTVPAKMLLNFDLFKIDLDSKSMEVFCTEPMVFSADQTHGEGDSTANFHQFSRLSASAAPFIPSSSNDVASDITMGMTIYQDDRSVESLQQQDMPDHFFDWNSAESLATISDSDYYDVLLMAASHHASDPFPAFGATSSGQPSRLSAKATPFTPSSRDKNAENRKVGTINMTVSRHSTSEENIQSATVSTSTGKIKTQQLDNNLDDKAAKNVESEETVPEGRIYKRRSGKSSKRPEDNTRCKYATKEEKAAFRFDADEFPSLVSVDRTQKPPAKSMSKKAPDLTPTLESHTATIDENKSPPVEWKSLIRPFGPYDNEAAWLAANFPKLNNADQTTKSRGKKPATTDETKSQHSLFEPATVGAGDHKMAIKSRDKQPATTDETKLQYSTIVGGGDNRRLQMQLRSMTGKSSTMASILGTRHMTESNAKIHQDGDEINADGTSYRSSTADETTNRDNSPPKRRNLCHKWLRWKDGTASSPCPNGKNCTFAHGEQHLDECFYRNFKTQLCKFWNAEMPCHRGAGCSYAHGESELRQLDPKKNNLNRTECNPRKPEELDRNHQYHLRHRDHTKMPKTSTLGAYLPQNSQDTPIKKIVT